MGTRHPAPGARLLASASAATATATATAVKSTAATFAISTGACYFDGPDP